MLSSRELWRRPFDPWASALVARHCHTVVLEAREDDLVEGLLKRALDQGSIVLLDEIPRTDRGKLDRAALLEMGEAGGRSGHG